MERHAIDENRTFELMREQSRSANRKLIDLATAVVDGHRLLPDGRSGRPDAHGDYEHGGRSRLSR